MVMNVQEEVEQKTFNIVVSTTKLTARTVLNAGRTALQQYQSKLLADKSSGKQSVRMLLRQNRGVSSVEINKTGMLSVKLSDEKCDKWYRRFYYNLRLQMQEYYQHKAVIMDSYWNHHMEKSYGEADEV